METKKIVVFGLGNRGSIYATFAKMYPDKFDLVAIIENNAQRIELAEKNFGGVPLFKDYNDFLKAKISADIVAIATQDEQHVEHAVAMMKGGYDLLLEKPIANTKEGCLEIYNCGKIYGRKAVVCHVLRYTPFYSTVKRIITSGKLGEVITINASENVGFYHQAHSFVRGPWRNKKQSSPMILAKCCHDMDILRYLMDEECKSVSSFGDLYYFNEKNAPEGATQYCSDCPIAEKCLYNAQKLYTNDDYLWTTNYFSNSDNPKEQILKDLKHTQYDKCVFKNDNDVVDHEVTIMQFNKGKTACHTMTAFSQKIYRDIKIHGTKAELVGNMEDNFIEIRYFTGEIEKVEVDTSGITVGAHMGGDYFMMNSLFKALNGEKVEGITYLDVSIESHLMSFAAEESRLNGGKPIEIVK